MCAKLFQNILFSKPFSNMQNLNKIKYFTPGKMHRKTYSFTSLILHPGKITWPQECMAGAGGQGGLLMLSLLFFLAEVAWSACMQQHMQQHAEHAISFAFWKICHFAVIFPSCKILQQNEKFSCQQNPTAKFDIFKPRKCEIFKLILQQCQIWCFAESKRDLKTLRKLHRVRWFPIIMSHDV